MLLSAGVSIGIAEQDIPPGDVSLRAHAPSPARRARSGPGAANDCAGDERAIQIVWFRSTESLEFCMARTFALIAGLLICGSLLFSGPAARAQINVRPEALTHYSYCVRNAKDRQGVFLLDRGTLYRCIDDIATSYFNYLGRQRAPERRAVEAEGVFIYRMIAGVGKCWNKIEDAYGNPMSTYGCDIYVEL